MNKHFISIFLFLLCLLVSSPAEARLTLGVLIGTDEAAGEITAAQVRSLAGLLAEKLQEDVVVKELSDSATLINWLDRFAMLDMALLSAKDVKANPGRFLLIGQVDERGKVNLVSRQGVGGDLPHRAAGIVRESGFVPWRLAETITSPAKQVQEESPPSVELESTTIDEVIAGQTEPDQTELQHVPPLRPGRAWAPQEESVYRDLLPGDKPLAKKLVLGVVPDPNGLVQTSEQAERLAAYLEEVLPVSVKVRDFTRLETFTEWFKRHRMVDIAVLSPAIAEANLGRDYQPVAKLFRTDKPGAESAELVVILSGQTEEVRAQLQRVFLDMTQTAEGRTLLAVLKINDVLVPDGVPGQPAIVDQPPVVEDRPIIVDQPPTIDREPIRERQKPVVESAVEAVEEPVQKLVPPTPAVAEPVEPLAPPEVIVKALPELPVIAEPMPILPVLEVPAIASSLPVPATAPVEPFRPVMQEILPQVLPEEPGIVVAPPVIDLEPVVLPQEDQPEVTAFVPDAVPSEPELPVVVPTEPDISPEPNISPESVVGSEQQKIIQEVLEPAAAVTAHESPENSPPVIVENEDTLRDDEIIALLGENTVAAVVAQPDIPPELRPPGIPVLRPGRLARRTTVAEDELLVASIPAPRKKIEPPRLPKLLPEQEPEPGIIYVVPFVGIMVPLEVNARIFDQFVDTLNQEGEAIGLQFVILKNGLQSVDPEWLAVRKYITGEIYAYVEDSGSSWTELRSKARLTYRQPNQNVPVFGFESPVKRFFDHDRSTIDVERIKLSDDISATLSSELLKVLRN